MPELSPRGSHRLVALETNIAFETLAKNAIKLTFSLPKGNYATMVMRELMKTDPLNY